MKKILILIAGPPATGKTYLIGKMRQAISDFFLITPDEIKELIYDKYGFDTLDQKNLIEQEAWQMFFHILNDYMYLGKRLIVSEYPFSNQQKGKLLALTTQHNYQVITIRLTAEFNTLWERRKNRDLEMQRHLGHIMTHYHLGDVVVNREQTDNRITKQGFKAIIDERGYNQFSMGKRYDIDVTDYAKVNYNALLSSIKKVIS